MIETIIEKGQLRVPAQRVREAHKFTAGLLIAGLLLIGYGCVSLVQGHNRTARLLRDSNYHNVSWNDESRREYASINRSIGRQCIHVSLGHFMVVAALLWQGRVRKPFLIALLVLSCAIIFFTSTVFL